MTLELTIEKTVTEKESVVIETPAFYKLDDKAWYKFTETQCLVVINSPNIHWKKMEILTQKADAAEYAKVLTGGEKISEFEFNKAFCDLHNEMAEIQLYETLHKTNPIHTTV